MWSSVYAAHYLLGRSVQMWLLMFAVIISLVGSVQMRSLVSGPVVLSSSAG